MTARGFACAVMLCLAVTASCLPAQGRVVAGADILIADSLRLIDGKRIGLVCNQTSVLADGTTLRAALRKLPGIELAALFAPEHGIDGRKSAGERVRESREEGVPVFSLHGEVRKPTAAMLKGIDVLLFDIQDAGVRFYTYLSTMLNCIEAAAEQGIPVVILDRPNPLNGGQVEGPVLNPAMKSFVGMVPVPVRHGMTFGELARMAVGEAWIAGAAAADLHIVPMRGWRRPMWYDETGLEWIPPSPNLPSDSTALVYACACFVEGCNASEGRGTGEPFRLIGAPFFNARRLADKMNKLSLAGVSFAPVEFVPSSRPVTPHPKQEGRRCRGARITVTRRDSFRPVAAGFMLLATLKEQARDSISFTSHLDLLAGVRGCASKLRSVSEAARFVKSWRSGEHAFVHSRKPYLLY
jgi:uncharacterized protein YbbC (DUF1343 family)